MAVQINKVVIIFLYKTFKPTLPTRIYSNFMFAVYMIILKLKLKYNVKLKYIFL